MPDKMSRRDAIIIGGGVAGSAAAIHLAGQGCKPLLLEKESSPHHKVCGEFISPEGEAYLAALGLEITRLGAEPVHCVRLMQGRKVAEAQLPFRGYSLSRYRLDDALLQLAQERGAEIRRGQAVRHLSRASSCWSVECADGSAISSDSVFLATGKHDLRDWPRHHGGRNDMIGFKMHYRLSPAQAGALAGCVEITLFEGGYAGLELIENGLCNMSLVVRKSVYARCGKNWPCFFGMLLEKNPGLGDRLAGSEACRAQPLAVFKMPYGFVFDDRADEPPGLYRLGDQMAVIPSFAGDGIAIALHTSHLATSYFRNGNSAGYHHQARAELCPQIQTAARLARLSSFPVTRKGFHLLCRIAPGILAAMARQTRLRRPLVQPEMLHCK